MSDASPKVSTLNQPAGGSPLLSVNNISVRFAGVKALSDVSFQVQPGELFAGSHRGQEPVMFSIKFR